MRGGAVGRPASGALRGYGANDWVLYNATGNLLITGRPASFCGRPSIRVWNTSASSTPMSGRRSAGTSRWVIYPSPPLAVKLSTSNVSVRDDSSGIHNPVWASKPSRPEARLPGAAALLRSKRSPPV